MRSLLPFLTVPPAVHALQCSCSPTSYSFRIDLSADCPGSIVDGDGIDGTLCFVGEGSVDDQMVQGGGAGFGPFDLDGETRRTTRVTSVSFLELDTTSELNIINQDSTYSSTDLEDGAVVSFDSVSKGLDPKLPLEEQTKFLPGGVVMVLFGVDENGGEFRNTVAWGYDLDYCDGNPLAIGDSIGWIVVDDLKPARTAFCPMTPALALTPQPLGTDSPVSSETVAPNVSPILTSSPPLALAETMTPTIAPIETMSPTTSIPETATPTASIPETMSPTISIIETMSPTTSIPETISPTASTEETSTPTTSIPETMSPTVSLIKTASPTSTIETNLPTIITIETMSPTLLTTETILPTDFWTLLESKSAKSSGEFMAKSAKSKTDKATASMHFTDSKASKVFKIKKPKAFKSKSTSFSVEGTSHDA